MQLIGHGHDHDVALLHLRDRIPEQVGVFLGWIRLQRGWARKDWPGKGLSHARIVGQRPQGAAVEGTDVDFTDAPSLCR